MKMLFHGRDFVDKVLVVAFESGVLDRIEFIIQQPFDDDAIIWKYNPLGRHPALVLDDGVVLYHGMLVCEYLDSLTRGRRLFPQDDSRWRALSQAILGDGLFDATSALVVQGLRKPADRNRPDALRHRQRIYHALAEMDRQAAAFGPDDFHIGHVGFACGLDFHDRRRPFRRVQFDPVDTDFDWRRAHPTLARWFDDICRRRPSLQVRASQLGIPQQGVPAL
jgi:glutathione S-transferase